MSWWIKIHRQIRDNVLFKENRTFSKFEAWLDILMDCNFKKWEMLLWYEIHKINVWSYVTSKEKLCKKYKWSKVKLNNFLRFLESNKMLSQKTIWKWTHKATELCALNYAKYQVEWPNSDTMGDPQATFEWPQYKKVKKVKNVKKKTNELYKPPKVKLFEESSFEYRISKFFLSDLISRWIASVIYQLTKKTELDIIESWAWVVSKMMRIDKLSEKQIKFLIEFTIKDDFWSTIILSMEKFRKKNSEGIPYYVILVWKIKDSWALKKETSQMSEEEALVEAKKRWLIK